MGFINMGVRLGCWFSKVVALAFGSQLPCAVEKIYKSPLLLIKVLLKSCREL